ncbi:PTS sugar transporter subunit IIA [Microbulbifer rhizosphaerae]|uniref:Mannitol/fructose-specific phosphotransferase system IIA component (Ntr-type) n=1 Tax=Microbulbifer rhizosphaerae TaxID=1562603 RepID=A0A7W4Z9B3_9GAMM|nr:PTS sugar transporter subunit IIA [Microbulbifer rhizosphaerae]MBB3061648.1 mannitol/fructose-specific phosphotransferase system IIA component (Ntr-type) [Microbulbifer rhizosphaerae]
MSLTDLLAVDCIIVDQPACSKDEILTKLVGLLDRAGKLADAAAFLDAVREREETGSTGLEQGVAVPHARSDAVREPALAFAIVPEGIDFRALDGL